MTQSFIDALMHFFALLYLPVPGKKKGNLKPELEDYIEKAGITVPAEDCLKVFSTYSEKYFPEFANGSSGMKNENAVNYKQMIIDAARRAQMNLFMRERYLLVLALTEFSGFYNPDDLDLIAHIRDIALNLNIPESDLNDGIKFIFHTDESTPGQNELRIEESHGDMLEGSWIERHKQEIDLDDRYVLSHTIRGKLYIRYFDKYHLFLLKYMGPQALFVDDKRVYPEYFYSFGQNAVLSFDDVNKVYFDEIAGHFSLKYNLSRINLQGQNIEYAYPQSGYRVKPFSFRETAGQMIGIVGNNGVGKSTILKLIAGINEPAGGDILINGSSLIQNKFKLQSVIGFVSHENMFYEECTVYDNIYYHARLSMGDMENAELRKKTGEILKKFDLQDISHLKPSQFARKRVSDFNRVSLNIALELIRDPFILCLDEPLLGLPYADAKRLLNILKEEAFEGKIVFISVHLPTPEIYNMFDKVWFIDQGGYVIFQGAPRSAREYFNSSGIIPFHIVSAREDMVSPEEVISLVETKKVRPDGAVSDERLVEPEKWYELFREKHELKDEKSGIFKPLPVKPSSIPGIEKQFLLYLLRLFRIRFTNISYLLLIFAVIPAIGSFIALLTRYSGGAGYSLADNKYLPLFIFLSVCYIFFAGLLNGAGELINEKARIQRDINLNLSYFSYVNAKFFFIVGVSLIQSILFTGICHIILKIEGQYLPFMIIYFSLLVLAGTLSLTLSSALKQISTLYILLPFIIIPSLVFSGYLISYNEFDSVKDRAAFRIVSDLVPSRWGYEALMLECYTNNKFNRNFFPDKYRHYQLSFLKDEVIPILSEKSNNCLEYYKENENIDSLRLCLELMRKEINSFARIDHVAPFESYNRLFPEHFNEEIFNELFGYLTYLDFYFENEISDLNARINFREELAETDSSLRVMRTEHHNKAVKDMVLEGDDYRQVFIKGSTLVKKGSPVYMNPDNKFGRAHFFAPVKKAGTQIIPTPGFNITVLWTMTAFLYLLFLTDALAVLFSFFRRNRSG